jgi:hypothetical protein
MELRFCGAFFQIKIAFKDSKSSEKNINLKLGG